MHRKASTSRSTLAIASAILVGGLVLAGGRAGGAPSAPQGGRTPIGGAQPLPPTRLAYSPASLSVPEGVPIVPLSPTVSGGPPDSFSLAAGTLPQGLALDPLTGVLSGTPTELLPPTVLTIVASNTSGQTSASLTLEVTGVAPAGLLYTPGTLVTEVAGGPYIATPTSTGGPIDSYAINGQALPTGLVLDPVLGIVSGSPLVSAPPTLYTIEASNETGTTSYGLMIQVDVPPAPSGLTYGSESTLQFSESEIVPLPPMVSGRVDAFRVTPSLPNRMLSMRGGSFVPGSGIRFPENESPIRCTPPEQAFTHPFETVNVWLPIGTPPLDGWPCVIANADTGYYGSAPYDQLDPADPAQAFLIGCLDAGIAVVFAGIIDSGPITGWYVPPGHPSGRWEDFDELMPEKDLLNAIQWTKTQGVYPIDSARIFLYGVSSGATLAAFVGLGPDLARATGSLQVTASSTVAGVLCFDTLTSFPAYLPGDTLLAHHWESVSQPGTSAVDMGDADPAILDANSVARVLLDPLSNGATTPVFLAYDCAASSIDYSNDPDSFPSLRAALGGNVHDLWHGAKLWERLLWLNRTLHEQRSQFFVAGSYAGTLGSLVGSETGTFSGTVLDSQDLYSSALEWLRARAIEKIPDPSGLRIHPKSGWIHGRPNVPTPSLGYRIEASNPGGTTSTTLTIRIGGSGG